MSISEVVSGLQSFFQLNFLFSGLEVSSTIMIAARVAVFLVLGIGALWFAIKVVLKLLDCVQTLLQSLAGLPRILYVLLFLVIPLSSDSVGAKWIGYILLVMAALGVTLMAVAAMVLWKFGVEQTLRLLNAVRSRAESAARENFHSPSNPDAVLRPVPDAPPVRTEPALSFRPSEAGKTN